MAQATYEAMKHGKTGQRLVVRHVGRRNGVRVVVEYGTTPEDAEAAQKLADLLNEQAFRER